MPALREPQDEQQQPGAPALAARAFANADHTSLNQLIAGAAGRLLDARDNHDAATLQSAALAARDIATDNKDALAIRDALADANPGVATANEPANLLAARQQQFTTLVPMWYKIDGPAPGAVVGIVLGSIAAFLLLAWLIASVTGNGFVAADYGEEEVVVRRGPRSRRSSGTHRSSRPEMRQYSRSPRRETVIVEERTSRRRSSISPPPPRSRPRSIIVEDRRRVSGDDIVEVIEEESIIDGPPRRVRRKNRDDYDRRY